MHRRSFLGRAGSALVALCALGSSALLTGCAALEDLLHWIPVGLSAVSSILSLLSGAGIVLGPGVVVTIGLIQAGLTDLKLAIVEYQSTNPPPAGALAKIDAFLSDLVGNIGNVLQQIPAGPANLITLVVGLFELVLSTIQGFMAQIPMAVSLTKSQAAFKRAMMTSQGKAVVISPRTNLSRRSFIHDFNKLVDAGGHKERELHEGL